MKENHLKNNIFSCVFLTQYLEFKIGLLKRPNFSGYGMQLSGVKDRKITLFFNRKQVINFPRPSIIYRP